VNLALTEVDATIQNTVSAAGNVNARLSKAIGSKSSYSTYPVPIHATAGNVPMIAAMIRCVTRLPDDTANHKRAAIAIQGAIGATVPMDAASPRSSV